MLWRSMQVGCDVDAARCVHRFAGMRGCVLLIVVRDQQMRVDTATSSACGAYTVLDCVCAVHVHAQQLACTDVSNVQRACRKVANCRNVHREQVYTHGSLECASCFRRECCMVRLGSATFAEIGNS